MKVVIMRRANSLGISLFLFLLCAVMQSPSHAEIDFFRSPAESRQPIPDPLRHGTIGDQKATIIFFISPGCGSCPEEASKLERELARRGWKYEIEGVFVGDPAQVGKYLAELRTYPFNFELGLDMDGRITGQYGVKTFPSAVIEVEGKRVVVTKAAELGEKLR
jgi:hypothetical protein